MVRHPKKAHDAHFHPNQYLSSGVGDDVDIHTWLFERVYPYEAVLTGEVRSKALCAFSAVHVAFRQEGPALPGKRDYYINDPRLQ